MGLNRPERSDPAQGLMTPVDDAIASGHVLTAPAWRGWIHTVAFFVAIVLGIVLIMVADGAAAVVGSAVFFASSLLLFGISALYHRTPWDPGIKAMVRRIDHANIFLLIAGTYTPLSLLLLHWGKALVLLSVVWAGAIVGIGFRVFWLHAPRRLYVTLYVLLGWVGVLFIAEFFRASWLAMTLVLVGGVFYTAGAVVYGAKRPNPFPRTFGFHELFHAFTVAAFVCQWTGVLVIAIDPPLN